MQITLHGAAGGEVTGSAYLIATDQAKVLVDFGLFQGIAKADERNRNLSAVNLRGLDAVLVTHAHLDHTGRLPLLAKSGWSGPWYATPASGELTDLILRDSAKVQAQDMERINRKRQRADEAPLEPLYGIGDVDQFMAGYRPVRYHEPVAVAPGIEAWFVEAGHMLGSSSIRLIVNEQGRTKRLVFSGDLGPKGAPILRDFEPFQQADLLFLESTYGDRDHKPYGETVEEFVRIVREAVERKGKILVPTFAVGRAQVLLTLLAWMFRNHRVEPFPVFLDSPMAIEASRIYEKHAELFDEETLAFLRQGSVREDLRAANSKATVSADESKTLNDMPGPCMILAGAGMCNAGRIVHHLRQNLAKPETSVLIVGYQGEGTLGRQLVEGAPHVSIFGDKIAVRARVHTLGGFSAHAGQKDLLAWIGAMAKSGPKVMLTHGEDRPRKTLAEEIRRRYSLGVALPALNESVTV